MSETSSGQVEPRFAPSKPPATPNGRPKIGVFMPTWIGDACMATPTLRAVRQAFPTATIVGIMRPVVRDVIQGAWRDDVPWIDDCILFEKRKRSATHTRFGLVRAMSRETLDVLLLLTNSFWSAAVGSLAGVPTVVGYDRDARGWLLSDPVPVLRNGKTLKPTSAVDYYLRLARQIGCDTSNKRMQLAISTEDERLRTELWKTVRFDRSIPTVVINSSAATDKLRIWPAEHVRELSLRLVTEFGCQVMLHCGPKERAAANRLAAEANHPRIASMGMARELPIGLSKSILDRADVVVSSDSGPRHLAVALDRPVVSLFGPTHVDWTRTYNRPELMISESLDCRPCYANKGCPQQHHRCMRDIGVQRVLDAVVQESSRLRVAAFPERRAAA